MFISDEGQEVYSVEDMNNTIKASPEDQFFHITIHDVIFKAPRDYKTKFYGGKSMSAQLREEGRILDYKKTYITWNKRDFTPGDFNNRFKNNQLGDSRLVDYEIHSPRLKKTVLVVQENPKYNPKAPDMMTYLQESNRFMEDRAAARYTQREKALNAIKNQMRWAELKEANHPDDIDAAWPAAEKIESIILTEKQNEHEMKQKEQRIRSSFPNNYHDVENVLPEIGNHDDDMLKSVALFNFADRVELAQDSIVDARDYNYWSETYDHGSRKYTYIESEQPNSDTVVIAGGLDEEHKKYFVKVDHGIGVHTATTKEELLEPEKPKIKEPEKPREQKQTKHQKPDTRWTRER